MKALKILKYVGFGILGVGFVILTIIVVMSLWNSLIPVLFHGPVLTFWQTAGLFILSKILLTGIAPGPNHGPKRDWRRKYHDKYRHECRNEEISSAPEQA